MGNTYAQTQASKRDCSTATYPGDFVMTMAHCPDRQSSRRFAPGLIEAEYLVDCLTLVGEVFPAIRAGPH